MQQWERRLSGQVEQGTKGNQSKPSASDHSDWGEIIVPALFIFLILLCLVSVVFYPTAWVLGFSPPLWWQDSLDTYKPGWFVTALLVLLFGASLLLSCAFFLSPLIEPFLQ